jgi:ferredoxin-type protein NapH
MGLFQKLRNLDRRQRLRYALLVLGILALAPPVGFAAQWFGGTTICGPLCPRMAIGTSFFRELTTRTAGVALLFAWPVSTFFFGRWICSHICPVGGLTEFGSKLLPSKAKVDYAKLVNPSLFRYGFLAAYLVLPLVGVASICCAYCSFSSVPETFGAIFSADSRAMLTSGLRLTSVSIFVLALGVVARDGRGHCHLLCPIGAIDSIANVVGARLPFAWRTRVNHAKCVGCGICAKDCSVHAITMAEHSKKVATIDYTRCYQCRKCEGNCPKDAITWSRPEKGREA